MLFRSSFIKAYIFILTSFLFFTAFFSMYPHTEILLFHVFCRAQRYMQMLPHRYEKGKETIDDFGVLWYDFGRIIRKLLVEFLKSF